MTARRSESLLGHRTFRWFLLIYALALAVRLVYFHEVRHNPLYDWPTLDENTNHHAALAILNGTDPPKAYLKAPLHMYYLVGVYKVFGPKPDIARLIQVFIAGLWAPLTFLIAERLFGRPTDIVAGILGAVFWTFVFFSTELLDVGIGGVFYLLTACLVIRLSDENRRKWLVCGISLGLGALTRPNILVVAPLLAATIAWVSWRRARRAGLPWVTATLRRMLLLAVGCGMTVFPVALRNRVVGGEWVLIAAYGGVNFYLANNPESDAKNVELTGLPDYVPSGAFDPNDPYDMHCFTYRQGCDYTRQKLGRPCTRGEMNDMMMSLGRSYVRQYPRKFLTDSFKRLCWFFNAYEFADNKDLYQFREFSRLLAGLSLFHYGILCPLIVLGLVAVLLDEREGGTSATDAAGKPLLEETGSSSATDRGAALVYYFVVLAGLIGPGVFFLVNARFRAVIVCLLAPLGAYGLVKTVAWCRRSVERRKTFIAGAVLSLAAVFSNANVFDYRPLCHPYLLFIYAAACGATGREDEMARTIEKIEHAMAAGVKGGGHGRGLYCLYDYYDTKRHLEKATYYGQQMVSQKQLDPASARRVFETFMKADKPDWAREVLSVMNRGYGGRDREFLGAAMVAFGRRYGDREMLAEAGRCYRQLATEFPTELEYHKQIEFIDELLTSPTSTGPASSRGTSRP